MLKFLTYLVFVPAGFLGGVVVTGQLNPDASFNQMSGGGLIGLLIAVALARLLVRTRARVRDDVLGQCSACKGRRTRRTHVGDRVDAAGVHPIMSWQPCSVCGGSGLSKRVQSELGDWELRRLNDEAARYAQLSEENKRRIREDTVMPPGFERPTRRDTPPNPQDSE